MRGVKGGEDNKKEHKDYVLACNDSTKVVQHLCAN